MRRIVIVALACASFGGVIGALATAAVQSQASPAAIAAALQKVQDKSAETSLQAINSKMTTVASRLASVPGLSASVATDLYQLDSQSYVDSQALFNELKLVCEGEGTNSSIGSCAAVGDPSPPTPARRP